MPGRVNVKPLIAGIYPLERFAEAFEQAKQGLKVLLTMA
jgi:threonine dehydrogenase-like Zn-dependent dehydrogenase